jgi:hypothetical protein
VIESKNYVARKRAAIAVARLARGNGVGKDFLAWGNGGSARKTDERRERFAEMP